MSLAASDVPAKRGLSDADRAEIERIVLNSKQQPTPGAIARKLGVDEGTVNWFMIRRGLITRQVKYSRRLTWVRNGVTCYSYTREHDERICALRRDGLNGREIAAIVTDEFGIPRSGHSIDVRLTMLGAYDGGPEQ